MSKQLGIKRPAAKAAPSSERRMGRPVGRHAKTTLTVEPDVLEDAKNGYWVTLGAGQHRTFAEYVTAALENYNQAMREEHTGGNPFPPRPTGNLPTTQPG